MLDPVVMPRSSCVGNCSYTAGSSRRIFQPLNTTSDNAKQVDLKKYRTLYLSIYRGQLSDLLPKYLVHH
jgi:hypothetical protein